MTDVVEIEGGIVRHIRREIVSETTLAAAAPHLEVRAPSIFPILPRGTIVVAFDPDEKRGVVLIERPPSRENLLVHFDRGLTANTPPDDFNRATGRTGSAHFNIMLPYLYFLYGFKLDTNNRGEHIQIANFAIDHTLLFMRKEPLRTLEDPMWHATIMNVSEAKICWGNTQTDNDTLAVRINHMINEFPLTTFNNHYGIPLPHGIPSLTAWEAGSDDPLFYRGWGHWTAVKAQVTDTKALILRSMKNGVTEYGSMPAPDDRFTDVIIPEPPRQFTVGRLREWMHAIPPALRPTFIREVAAEAATIQAEMEAAAAGTTTRRRRNPA